MIAEHAAGDGSATFYIFFRNLRLLHPLRRPRRPAEPAVAYHPVPTRVLALAVTPAVAPPEPDAPVAAAPAPVVADDTPVAAPVTVAQAEFPPVAAAASHHVPFFLAPLLFGVAALAGGSGSGPAVAPPAGCP